MAVNCPNCGAPLSVDPEHEAAVCDYCDSAFYPKPNQSGVRVFGGPSEHACPVCRDPLAQAALARHAVEYCERCGGILIAVSAFTDVVQALQWAVDRHVPPHPLEPGALDRSLVCPGCRHAMDTHPYAGPGNVVIDNCPRCELNWLDAGELERIAV